MSNVKILGGHGKGTFRLTRKIKRSKIVKGDNLWQDKAEKKAVPGFII